MIFNVRNPGINTPTYIIQCLKLTGGRILRNPTRESNSPCLGQRQSEDAFKIGPAVRTVFIFYISIVSGSYLEGKIFSNTGAILNSLWFITRSVQSHDFGHLIRNPVGPLLLKVRGYPKKHPLERIAPVRYHSADRIAATSSANMRNWFGNINETR